MASRALISNRLLSLPLSEHIFNFMLGGKRNVLKEMQALDKEMYNALNSVPAEVRVPGFQRWARVEIRDSRGSRDGLGWR